MKLRITKTDLAASKKQMKARPNDCAFTCPIACALNRTKPGGQWGVDSTHADVYTLKGIQPGRRLALAASAKQFLRTFDTGRAVSPCVVELFPN